MAYQASAVGNLIASSWYVPRRELLEPAAQESVLEMLIDALKQDSFTILEEPLAVDGESGYGLGVMIAESHATIHTYPRHNTMVFSLYTCRGKDDGSTTYDSLYNQMGSPEVISWEESKIPVEKRSQDEHCEPGKSAVKSGSGMLITATLKVKDWNNLEGILGSALPESERSIAKKLSHTFEPQGYSSLVLTPESDASIHTYPEKGSLVVTLYTSSGIRSAEKIYRQLFFSFGPEDIINCSTHRIPLATPEMQTPTGGR